jgi:hypothetical protein
MSQIDLKLCIGRLITDADFRSRAAVSLEGACRSEGITLTSEEISFLKHIDLSKLGSFAEVQDDPIRRT